MSPSFSPKVFWQPKLKANLFAIVDLEIGHFSSPSLVLKNEKDLLFGVRKKDGDIVFFPKGLDAWNWKIICGCQHVWQGETAMVLKNGNFSMFLSVMKFKQNAEWVLSRKIGFLHFKRFDAPTWKKINMFYKVKTHPILGEWRFFGYFWG